MGSDVNVFLPTRDRLTLKCVTFGKEWEHFTLYENGNIPSFGSWLNSFCLCFGRACGNEHLAILYRFSYNI